MKKGKHKFFISVLSIIIVLLLGACGNGEDDANSEGSSEASSNQESSDQSTDGTENDSSDWPDRIVVGANAPGGSYYVLGGVLGTLIEQELDIPASVQDTGGGLANIQLADGNEIELGLTGDIEAYDYYYEESDNFSVIAPLSESAFQMVVREDSNFESFSDIDNMSVSLGRAVSTHSVGGLKIFEALGLEPKDI